MSNCRSKLASLLIGALAAGVPACGESIEIPSQLGRSPEFRCAPGGGAGIIGLDKVVISGIVDITGNGNGDVFGNELVDLSGDVYVEGDVVSAGNVSNSGATVAGVTWKQDTGLDVAPDESAAQAAETWNNNTAISSYIDDGQLRLAGSTALTMPSGTYYFGRGMNVSGDSSIIVDGPVRIFTRGEVSISGVTETGDGNAHTMEVLSVDDVGVSISGTSDLHLHVFAPLADVSISGETYFTGTVLGNVVDISGTAAINSAGDASNYMGSCDEDDGDGRPPEIPEPSQW